MRMSVNRLTSHALTWLQTGVLDTHDIKIFTLPCLFISNLIMQFLQTFANIDQQKSPRMTSGGRKCTPGKLGEPLSRMTFNITLQTTTLNSDQVLKFQTNS